jgi:hypothetical protein
MSHILMLSQRQRIKDQQLSVLQGSIQLLVHVEDPGSNTK